jgi:OmpA-OmpF porin, OOP family
MKYLYTLVLIFIFNISHASNIFDLPECSAIYGSTVSDRMKYDNCYSEVSLPDGEFQGEFRDGKYDGYGVLDYTLGGIYKGNFKNGLFHGKGVLNNSDGLMCAKGICEKQSASTYDGQFKNGLKHGQGSIRYNSGETIIGVFFNGTDISEICISIGLIKGSESYGLCVLKYLDKIEDVSQVEPEKKPDTPPYTGKRLQEASSNSTIKAQENLASDESANSQIKNIAFSKAGKCPENWPPAGLPANMPCPSDASTTVLIEHADRKERLERLAKNVIEYNSSVETLTPSQHNLNAYGDTNIPVLRVSFDTDVFFDTSQSEIKPEAFPVLRIISDNLEKEPADVALFIVGHTDSTGSADLNYNLGLERANAVAEALSRRGVYEASIYRLSLGEGNPIANNRTSVGRAKNRRVEFLFGANAKAVEVFIKKIALEPCIFKDEKGVTSCKKPIKFDIKKVGININSASKIARLNQEEKDLDDLIIQGINNIELNKRRKEIELRRKSIEVNLDQEIVVIDLYQDIDIIDVDK